MGQIERAAGHPAVIEPGLILVDFLPLVGILKQHISKSQQASGFALVAYPVHK